jgi:ActR/RegA family two-component response regulator
LFVKPALAEVLVQAIVNERQVHDCAAYLREIAAWPCSLARFEWEYLNSVYVKYAGNVRRTAKTLRIPRQTLYRKLRKSPPST